MKQISQYFALSELNVIKQLGKGGYGTVQLVTTSETKSYVHSRTSVQPSEILKFMSHTKFREIYGTWYFCANFDFFFAKFRFLVKFGF